MKNRRKCKRFPAILNKKTESDQTAALRQNGYSHIAFSLGSNEAVNRLTERLREDGYAVVSGPRTTGDGYYESAVLDGEGNRIELTV